MGIKYNDYLRLTKSYLREIDYYKTTAETLASQIGEIEATLKGISTKIANYESTHGGYSDLNAVEADAEKRIEQETTLKKAKADLKQITAHIKHVDKCLDILPLEEKHALYLYYVGKKTYMQVSEAVGWGGSTTKRRIEEATKSVAWMLFGDKALVDVLFIEGGKP